MCEQAHKRTPEVVLVPAGQRASSTVPTVPTPVVAVELSDLRRRGVPLAVLGATGAGGTDVAPVGLAPDTAAIPDEVLVSAGLTGRAGEVWTVPAALTEPATARWFVGVGTRVAADWRSAGAALIRSIQDSGGGDAGVRSVDVALPVDVEPVELRAFVLGMLLGGYQFRVTGDRSDEHGVRSVRLWCDHASDDQLRAELDHAVALGRATALARDLANTPSNVKDPAWLASAAERVTAGLPGLTTTVRDEKWLAEQGFGGVLAVGAGSVAPPRLVELAWRPRGASGAPHLVLVGKGITFDTGGVSLKPNAGMHLMRTDMSGAAAVIAALRAIATLRLPIRVTGVAPMAENHLSGSAYRPGDVVRHVDGRTTEVLNTDAEGRMLLADGLGYAVRRLRPDLLVDVATLTGSMKVALGVRTAGFFASDDDLADRIGSAGDSVGESWWRMPLLEAHAEDVASDIADVRQTPPGPGSVTAALFLREFTAGLPWAHLDIAGPARADKTYAEVVPGGTGFAARTLVALAESFARTTRG
jgi:leucyl aminopeptidase